MVKKSRVDIITEVLTLASQMAMPREGHMEAVFHVFAYLKARHNLCMVFDPTYLSIDKTKLQEHEWKCLYGDVKEAIQNNCPKPLGREVDISMFVDSNYTRDDTKRRSRTVYFIYMNLALVNWLSKNQATIETSVFRAKFVAMKQGMEAACVIQYKLRMMGLQISGLTYVYGHNMLVI